MAILIVCAVRDRAIDAFMQPLFVPAVGLAIRSFGDEVNRKESPMNAHPEDYDLYELGTYNDSNGVFDSTGLRQVAIGKDVVRPVSSTV